MSTTLLEQPRSSLRPLKQKAATPAILFVMVAAGGAAALSWEIVWQLKAALSLGVSALGTAVTLATLMGGMAIGALAMGAWLHRRVVAAPIRVYGCLELVIGVSGLLLGPAFAALEQIDSRLYQAWSGAAPIWHLMGVAIVLGPPAIAMGASLPIFGLLARRYGTSLSAVYAWNTAGAAIGVLAAAFLLLPAFGVFNSSFAIAFINVCIAVVAFRLRTTELPDKFAVPGTKAMRATLSYPRACLVAFVTGFATLALEVAWFRSLRAAYFSTTYTFAILLAAVLVALALAARKAMQLRQSGWRLATLLAGSGTAILLATPVVERFDFLRNYYVGFIGLSWFVQTLVIIGPAIFLLGVPLPWLLDEQPSPRRWARLYTVNTIGAICGSLLAAWGLLPVLGFARTAWLIGLLVLSVAAVTSTPKTRWRIAALAACSLAVAMLFESGIGRTRTLGPPKGYELVAFAEAPDSTVSVVESHGRRHLFIDGFSASDETGAANYMAWMGRLPMLLHANPKDALVICFGTGQTAHAVREEAPVRLDIVDLSQAVFSFADRFPTNHDVLGDPRTRAIVMDGRAWLRRTSRQYDVITLEPMPPTFAGVNALYSREFYELAAARLRSGGIIAQWLPIHLVDRYQAASIAAAFQDVFPDSILWLDPASLTGILVGRKGPGDVTLAAEWPGLLRERPGRTMNGEAIRAATILDAAGLAQFAKPGKVITDDNQLLSYGWSTDPVLERFKERADRNFADIHRIAGR